MKPDPAQVHMQQRVRTLYAQLTHLEDDTTRVRSLMFSSLPSKSMYPDYYQAIATPISLKEIKVPAPVNPCTRAITSTLPPIAKNRPAGLHNAASLQGRRAAHGEQRHAVQCRRIPDL